MLYREIETELLPLCRDQGVGVIVYNPLAGGLLTGKHLADSGPKPGTRFTLGASGELYRDRYWHAAQFEAVETLRAYCLRRGWDLATASVAWVLQQPGITSAIVGASRADQLEASLAGAEPRIRRGGTGGVRIGLVDDPAAADRTMIGEKALGREDGVARSWFRGQTSRLIAQSGFLTAPANSSRRQPWPLGAIPAIVRWMIANGRVKVNTMAVIAATSTFPEPLKV